MWRKFQGIVFLVLAVGVPLWANPQTDSVQRQSTAREFKNDVDWAVDPFDVKKLKQSFFAAAGRNINTSSLSYFQLTAGLVKVLPFNVGFSFYDSESLFVTNNPAHRTNLNFSGGSDQNVTRTVSEHKWLADNSSRIFALAADLSAIGLPLGVSYRIAYSGANTTNATFAIDFANQALGAVSTSSVVETYTTNDNQVLTRTKTTYGEGAHDAATLENILTLGTKIGELTLSVPLTVSVVGTAQKASYEQIVENPAGTTISKDTANLSIDNKNFRIRLFPRLGFTLVKGTDIEVALSAEYFLPRNPKYHTYKRVVENIPADTVTNTEGTKERKSYLHLPLGLEIVVKQSYKLGDALSLKGRVRANLNYTLVNIDHEEVQSTETKVAGTVTSSEKIIIKDLYNTNTISSTVSMPLGVEYALQKWLVLRMGTTFSYGVTWRWAKQTREKPSREVNGTPAPIDGTSYDPVNVLDSSYSFSSTSSTTFNLGLGWLATDNFQMDFGYEFGGTGDIFSLSQWRLEAIYRF
ncbi:MAG: hypothetical protein N2314_04705 [Brevinematales bacterium]|nr:hypothetical protein [Brevinematales bacterium]